MQHILSNMIAGLMIITNPKVKVGEVVELLHPFNEYGIIEELQIRYTVVRLFSGRKSIIPNTLFLKTPLKTFKTQPLVRNEILASVALDSDMQQVEKILTEAVNQYQYIREP